MMLFYRSCVPKIVCFVFHINCVHWNNNFLVNLNVNQFLKLCSLCNLLGNTDILTMPTSAGISELVEPSSPLLMLLLIAIFLTKVISIVQCSLIINRKFLYK